VGALEFVAHDGKRGGADVVRAVDAWVGGGDDRHEVSAVLRVLVRRGGNTKGQQTTRMGGRNQKERGGAGVTGFITQPGSAYVSTSTRECTLREDIQSASHLLASGLHGWRGWNKG